MTSSENKGRKKRSPTHKPFRMVPRDFKILTAAYECRALTSPQVSALFFPAPTHDRQKAHSRCLYRLKLLYEQGLLTRTEQPQVLSDGRKPFVYALAKKGAQMLCAVRGCEIGELDWRERDGTLSLHFLEHLRLSNDVRVALTLAVRQRSGVTIEEWQDEQTLRRTHAKDVMFVSVGDGRQQKALLVPDGYMRLQTVDEAGEVHTYHHFWEIDRRTETGASKIPGRRDWAHKITNHMAYYSSGLYEQRYGAKGLRVLTVTTGAKRLENLKRITEEVGGKARFWFTTFDLIKNHNILTDAIWQIASREGTHSLLWE